MRVGGDDAIWNCLAWSVGDGGEIERIGDVGDEGCDIGGDSGLTVSELVVMGAGIAVVRAPPSAFDLLDEFVEPVSESMGFKSGLVDSDSGGEIETVVLSDEPFSPL